MKASDDPLNVGVDRGGFFTKRNRRDRCGRISTDAGQLPQFLSRSGELASPGALAGAGNEIAGTGIVTKSRPLTKNVLVLRTCKGFNRGPTANEPLEPSGDACHRCLLQ